MSDCCPYDTKLMAPSDRTDLRGSACLSEPIFWPGVRGCSGSRWPALAAEAELVLADDVCSAVDARTEVELWEALRRRGMTVLGSSSSGLLCKGRPGRGAGRGPSVAAVVGAGVGLGPLAG
jgi:hypothetical protein